MRQGFLGNTATLVEYALGIKAIADTYQLVLWQGIGATPLTEEI